MTNKQNEAVKEKHFSKKRVRKGFFHFLSGKMLAAVFAFAFAIIVIRELSVSDYAAYIALIGVLLVIMLITALGIERVVPKFLSELIQKGNHQRLFKLTWQLFFIKLIAIVVGIIFFVLFSPTILELLKVEHSLELIVAFCMYILLYGMSIHMIINLQTMLLQRQATIGIVIEWVTKLTNTIIYIYINGELTLLSVLWIQVFSVFLGGSYNLFSLYLFTRKLRVSESSKLPIRRIERVLRFSFQNYMQSLTGFHTFPSTGRLLSASLLEQSSTAALGFAYALTEAFKRYLPATLLFGLVEPVLMAKYSERQDIKQVSVITSTLLKLNLFVIIPVMFWIVFSGEPVMSLLSKDKYTEMGWLVSSMMFILVLESQFGIQILVCNTINKSSVLIFSNLYSLLFFPVLIFLLYQFKLQGFVIGLVILHLIRNFVVSRYLHNFGYKFAFEWLSVLKIVLIAIFSVAVGQELANLLPIEGIAVAFASLTLSACMYLFISFIVKPFTGEQSGMLNGLIGKKLFIW